MKLPVGAKIRIDYKRVFLISEFLISGIHCNQRNATAATTNFSTSENDVWLDTTIRNYCYFLKQLFLLLVNNFEMTNILTGQSISVMEKP